MPFQAVLQRRRDTGMQVFPPALTHGAASSSGSAATLTMAFLFVLTQQERQVRV